MTKRTSTSLSGCSVKAVAVKKAAMKKSIKPQKKAVTPSKAPAKKPVAVKKVVEPKSKPSAAKSSTEKKAAPVSTNKSTPSAAKKVAPAPAKKEIAKKSAAAQPVPSRTATKKVIEEKVTRGTSVASKKTDSALSRTGAVSKSAEPGKASSLPIKVEPKIIEVRQPEIIPRSPDETLFSAEELETFRVLLFSERSKILQKARRTMEEGNIQIDKNEMMDEVDQASAMVEQNLTFRLLDRDRKLLSEIDHALVKIDSGDFGYCEGTGEAIPKRRLELRPWCRHSVKYKEKLERMKKSGRGVVDEDEV
ncbi:MAG: TraR/DksA C4-type zinc finger protein [Proteobacteria bacterium]|nr:TraR/DksA C4-type zinc finger protein [Pseudomonadota bacterium]